MPPKVLKYSMPLLKTVGDLAGRDHGRQRMAVADRLAHGDDVGHHALRLEGPPMAADAAEADLHLVGDADAARLRAPAGRPP